MKRFVTEYANYQITEYLNNDLMQAEYKNAAINRIDRAVFLCDRGMITINECMCIISNPLD